MESKELRLGNYILYCNSEKELDAETMLSLLRYTTPFEPIPLTEEWLLKFGFTKNKLKNYSFQFDENHYLEFVIVAKQYYPHIYELAEFSNCGEQCIGLNVIYYVHQLQNLYFALTGKELTI